MSWETVPLDDTHPRKLYGQEVNELSRTLNKIRRRFSREQEGDPFSPARGRYFLTGQNREFSTRGDNVGVRIGAV